MMAKIDKKIGIIGIGAVGTPLKAICEVYFKEVKEYDKKGNYDWQPILGCNIVFICVPTPEGADERLDCSCIEEVLTRLDNDGFHGIVAIKSTLAVGFMDKACDLHPTLRLVYNPEFLREKSAYQWTINPDRIVVSGELSDAKEVLSVFVWAEHAKKIITDHRSAEIGKLAHNAFIATKVSFTNEIEGICQRLDAKVEDVMDIVASDRRVISKEHLQPHLGPYGGKCVPKDTKELKNASKSDFLQAVEDVNEETKRRYRANENKVEGNLTTKSEIRLVAIIPTKSRLTQLEKALTSVAEQTLPPNELIIVGEEETDLPTDRKAIESKFSKTKVSWLFNARTKNLSGAINTAAQFLIKTETDPEKTYLAFLDDDDRWEPDYLQTLHDRATSTLQDLVISGLIRHEIEGDVGIKQTIPQSINQNMFLVGNPHIQGSNLFVKLSTFLRAGGFDENLPSCTDRDFMIRLLDLGNIQYSCIPRHLVHHYASSVTRLSTYGSASKIQGLTKFLQKYQDRMTAQEILQFKERAETLFGWTESLVQQSAEISSLPTPPKSTNKHAFHLVIGFTASHLSCAGKLLRDLNAFQKRFPQPISLVILDNTGNGKQLEQLVAENKTGLFSSRLVSESEVDQDAEAGKLGTFYIKKERRKGPSYGRTALHRFLYLTGAELVNPVFWILDDDVRLDKIVYASNNQVLTPEQFQGIVDYLLEQKVAICVAGIMGDPPLPIASSIRGQLLELSHYLRKQTGNGPSGKKLDTDAVAERFPDQYYDLSINRYDHLETPIKASLNIDEPAFAQYIDSLFEGRNQLRPALPTNASNIMRGGNTIVTDIECLRTHINSSPRINGVELRRGDTSWVELNRYVGGELVGYENKKVISLPLFLRQERAPTFKPKLLGETLAADLLGGAFVRAFTHLLQKRSENSKAMVDIGSTLAFSEEDCHTVIAETMQNLEQRLTILRMSAWRINGLISSIRYQIANGQGTTANTLTQEEIRKLCTVLKWVEEDLSIQRVKEFSQNLKIGVAEGITEYLLTFEKARQQFATNLGLKATEKQKRTAKELIQRHFNVASVELIGEGQEGVVYSDGLKAYKYFITNGVQKKSGLLDLIRDKLNPSAHLKRIVTVEKIIVEGNQVLLSMPLIEGKHYNGGRITELLDLLRECKEIGVVTTNLWPKNLIVGKNGLVYVDIGRSLAPFREDLFNEMCKRAYLTYRWHFRSDLKELLTRSLKDPNLPELFGFEEFKKSIQKVDVHTQMDDCLIKECIKSNPRNVLDFGCGTGTIADQLTDYGCKVDCYDPNPERFNSRPHSENVTLLQPDGMDKSVKDGQGYDLVLCNLVLCSIESDIEVEAIMQRLRSLTSQNGRTIIGLCNPLSDEVKTSPSQTRKVTQNQYHHQYAITETTPKGNQRIDWHRPISWYKHIAHKAGFEIEETVEVPSVDTEQLSPSSDQILLVLRPLIQPKLTKTVSLMIKASAMEWQTIEKQVRHIVSQLEGPQQFKEKIVVTDTTTEGFTRQYAKANLEKFQQALQKLLSDQVIDRVIFVPNDSEEIKKVYNKWFGLKCSKPRAINGQPTYMTLYGLDQCKGDYVLQMDCDCIFFRRSRVHDYLGEMISLFDSDPTAVTVALPIPYSEPQPFKKENENTPFRVEVRCCLLNMAKLKTMLPLENQAIDDQLSLPWHRSLDLAILKGKASSYRGGNPQSCFVHVPNFRKTDVNDWMSILDAAEMGTMIPQQLDKIQLMGEAVDWLGKRSEEMVILMRGRNVPLSRVRRCVASLQDQAFKNWSAVIIDANSSNGLDDLYKFSLRKELGEKVTYVRNHILMSSMENIDYVTSSICVNSQSIIVHLDLDDALIGMEVLSKIKAAYDNGADVTVGSMLRTDKQAQYQVTFRNLRSNRGGNVWQHLRSYRKYIYDAVPEEYFKVDGEWVKHSEDWAFMIPIVELAKNPVEIADKIYFYEPSEDKSERDVQERELLIAKIMVKPSLGGLN
jgi:glycosyltransferase involved in cell wall biosynthesis/SAM-dependent methyltransferase